MSLKPDVNKNGSAAFFLLLLKLLNMATLPVTFSLRTGLEDEDEVPSRFITFTEDQLKSLTRQKLSKNTENSTKVGIKLLKKYCSGTGVDFEEEVREKESLDNLLMKFYAGIRTERGDVYKNNSLISFRNSLHRYFMEKQKVNIFDDHHFKNSNTVFRNVLKNGKSSGKGNTTHYPEIEPEDLEKLNNSFDINSPVGLQEFIWFNIMLRLIRRGRENLRSMTKETFSVATDATGKQYVYQVNSESDKNHGIQDNSFDTTGEGRIYQNSGEKCPVKMFKKYLSLLHPKQNAFWQRPRDNISNSATNWYCNVPLGEKYLSSMMPKMSLKYKLSQRYTNHSIRVSGLQILDSNSIDSRHIMRISGHKRAESITNYARRLSAANSRKISTIFDENMCMASSSSSSATTSSVHDVSLIDDEVSLDVSDRELACIPNAILSPLPSTSQAVFRNQINYRQQNQIPLPLNSLFNQCHNCRININYYGHNASKTQ